MFKSIWKLLKFGFKAIVFFIIVSIMVEIGDAIFKVSESEDIVFDFSIPKLLCLGAYVVICIVILKKIFFSSSGSKYSSHYTPANTYNANTSSQKPFIPSGSLCCNCGNLDFDDKDGRGGCYCTAKRDFVHPSSPACSQFKF